MESLLSAPAGVVYTLATGRLFCPFPDFQDYAEKVLDRPILTHEFADEKTWAKLREVYEAKLTEAVHGRF